MALTSNPYQGPAKKVLCLCSAGLLRSPTIAWVLAQEPYNYNTRAAGVRDYALIELDDVLIHWADEIVCADAEHTEQLLANFDVGNKKIITLYIPDKYERMDPELITLIKERYKATDEQE